MWQLATAIAAVRLVTDLAKRLDPKLTGRSVQVLVLALSVGAAFLVAGPGDLKALITAIGAIFAGAIAFYSVVSK
jgi:hypothetical protein